jgi:hypothetical protein
MVAANEKKKSCQQNGNSKQNQRKHMAYTFSYTIAFDCFKLETKQIVARQTIVDGRVPNNNEIRLTNKVVLEKIYTSCLGL